jgi:redox-sensitive bicupin YhaK (pirin superfamily)
MSNATIQTPRRLERLVQGQDTQDGAGVKLTRVLTQDLQQRLDPFLMLDAFGSDKPGDYIAGFPNHPHRGFETITYMIAGRMRHRDSGGNEGLLQNGGVQWMTAGRGLIHSEMPEQEEGVMEGFQLWLNLPGKDKMCDPWYQDIQSDSLPEVTTDNGVMVRVIAGSSQGTTARVVRSGTEPLYLDLHFPETDGALFEQPLPATHNAFVYVYRGELEVLSDQGSNKVPVKRMGIMHNEGDGVRLRGRGNTRAILIAGKPLREPIVQYGPFVMNTREQIMQAVDDFRNGRMG